MSAPSVAQLSSQFVGLGCPGLLAQNIAQSVLSSVQTLTDSNGNYAGQSGPNSQSNYAGVIDIGCQGGPMGGLLPFVSAMGRAPYAPVTIWCVGDSIVYGLFSNGTGSETDALGDVQGWVGNLRYLPGMEYPTNLAGTAIGQGGFMNSQDARVTAVGAGSASSIGLNGLAKSITNTAQTLSFPIPSCMAYDIIYYENNGADGQPTTGNFQYQTDGGAATPVNYAGAAQTYKVVSVTGLSQATHTVLLTGESANPAWIVGIRYHSGAGFVVGRLGRPSWTSADVLGLTGAPLNSSSAVGQVRLLKAFSMGTPDLVIISLGHNDCTQQPGYYSLCSRAAYQQNLQAMITQVSSSGGCVLLVSEPDPNNVDPVGFDTYRSYWDIARQLALTNPRTAHIYAADWLGTNADSQTLVNQTASSGVHPVQKGHGVMGRMVFEALRSFQNYRVRATY